MHLTELQIRKIKPRQKAFKLTDERGMYLLVNPNGGKYWRLKYRMNNKERLLALGTYPEISLKQARDKREEAKRLISNGIDPSFQRQTEKLVTKIVSANTFEALGREWFEKEQHVWSESHRVRVKRYLEKDLYPLIGVRPINAISAPELLAVLRKVENRRAIETAHRVKQAASQVFRYAIITGRAERDPSADLKGALQKPVKGHYSAVTDVRKVGPLLHMIDGYDGSFTVKCALKLSPLVFVRPGELRRAEWAEIDFKNARWEIPASKMKMKSPHIIPLAKQSLEILKALYEYTGSYRYVFPNGHSPTRPMSENAIRAALRRMEVSNDEMTGHGFRAMARTLLDEELEFRVDWIEQQLAHAVRDSNGRAYNRTKHLKQRSEMMQRWADYLDELKQKN